MRKIFIGPCPLCLKQVWKFKRPKFINFAGGTLSVAFKSRPYEQNEDGTHVWFLLSDGTRMRVAICKTCLLTLTDEQARQVLADITFTKLEAIKNDKRLTEEKRYKLFDRIRTVEIFKWSDNEAELIDILKGENGQEYSIRECVRPEGIKKA